MGRPRRSLPSSPVFKNLPLWANAALFLASAAVVWLAGSRLARYVDAIADKTGIGRQFLGILLLGGVTSLPELASSATATLTGSPALAVNGVLGSAAVNVLLLAVADAVFGRNALTSTPGTPQVMLQAVLGIVLLSLVVGAVVAGDVLVLGIGAFSWAMLAGYVGAVWLLAKAKDLHSWRPERGGQDEQGPSPDAGSQSTGRLSAKTAAAGAVILVAGYVLAQSGDAIARQTGLGQGFFGAVFLGLATSLPELSTVIASVRLRRYEMAMADVFGTNLFNVTIVVLIDALHGGEPVLTEVSRSAGFGALLAILLTAIFLVGMIERRDRTVLRMGIDSLLVLGCYLGGVVVLYLIG